MCSKFKYAPMFQLGPDTTEYYKIPDSEKLVKTSKLGDKTILEVSPEALTLVAQQSFHDCEFMLRRTAVPAQRRDRRQGRTSFLPGYRHRHHPRRKGTARVDGL